MIPVNVFLLFLLTSMPLAPAQETPLKIFISVDMEGIGGIGTSEMTHVGGKDYLLGRQLMTDEVNAVVAAILEASPAEITINDSHGDMRNLQHTRLDTRVEYIQGNIKPLGMVQGLDNSYDGVIFLGYHTRAGTENGFLAHTGSGIVKGLWLHGIEVGEAEMNAAFAGSLGVPVLMAAGDLAFTQQILERINVRTVATKEAIGAQSCRLYHPETVRRQLGETVKAALDNRGLAEPFRIAEPVEIVLRFSTTTQADVLQAIPGMRRTDGFSVAYTATDMDEAYRLIRLMYKYVQY